MEVEITDAMENLEEPGWKKSLRKCLSAFTTTNTSIENFLTGIHEYHLPIGGITVQDEL